MTAYLLDPVRGAFKYLLVFSTTLRGGFSSCASFTCKEIYYFAHFTYEEMEVRVGGVPPNFPKVTEFMDSNTELWPTRFQSPAD